MGRRACLTSVPSSPLVSFHTVGRLVGVVLGGYVILFIPQLSYAVPLFVIAAVDVLAAAYVASPLFQETRFRALGLDVAGSFASQGERAEGMKDRKSSGLGVPVIIVSERGGEGYEGEEAKEGDDEKEGEEGEKKLRSGRSCSFNIDVVEDEKRESKEEAESRWEKASKSGEDAAHSWYDNRMSRSSQQSFTVKDSGRSDSDRCVIVGNGRREREMKSWNPFKSLGFLFYGAWRNPEVAASLSVLLLYRIGWMLL